MLYNISWSDYLTAVSVSAFVYYLCVVYLFYRHELVALGKRRSVVRTLSDSVPLPASQQQDFQPKPIERIIQSFKDEVQAYLEEGGQHELSKDTLLQHLSIIASKYSPLALFAGRDSLDQFITDLTITHCAVLLSESEVRAIWERA